MLSTARKCLTIVLALAAAAIAVTPAAANAATPEHYVPCEKWLEIKPHRCTFEPYANAAHYQQAPITNIHWRSWGGRHAVARGTYVYNMGYRAPIRFQLYWPVRDGEGDLVYTRLRGVLGRGSYLDDHGKRVREPAGPHHPFRMRLG